MGKSGPVGKDCLLQHCVWKKKETEHTMTNPLEAVLIYPHQLFEDSVLLKKDRRTYLVEEPLLFTQYRFHKQKLMFHRASMRSYYDELISRGYTVTYLSHDLLKHTGDVVHFLKKDFIEKVFIYDLVDDWMMRGLRRACKENDISIEVSETPMFLTTSDLLKSYVEPLLSKGKRLQQKDFYVWQRKRLGILLDTDGTPTGGSWSYDEENRKKLPKNIVLPEDPEPSKNPYVNEARAWVEEHFSDNYGSTEAFFYPVTHAEAKLWLAVFLRERFEQFGPYEDAMSVRSVTLFHSILSPLLNAGLLTPAYVLAETLAYTDSNNVPLPSVEGFIRQLIGWREYMRMVYMVYGRKSRTSNYFKAETTIPSEFWTGTTGIVPIDDTIKTVLTYAYAHHIPRLMVLGNFMNLCGFKPDDSYRWFMELFIDAYDWVMVPNVYSMALYADGGLITSKPYIAGSNYLLKMSDYPRGEWTQIWDALFWNFVGTHFTTLQKEGRLGFIGVQYGKMSPEKKTENKKIALEFLKSLGVQHSTM